MRRVRQRDTDPELLLRQALWKSGLRYRVHQRVAGTRPDVLFTRAKVAVFVDGCFWHGCPVHYRAPKDNAAFWREKFEANLARDARDSLRLREAGYEVVRLWSCQVKKDAAEAARIVAGVVSDHR